jgi:hypothetical protein
MFLLRAIASVFGLVVCIALTRVTRKFLLQKIAQNRSFCQNVHIFRKQVFLENVLIYSGAILGDLNIIGRFIDIIGLFFGRKSGRTGL